MEDEVSKKYISGQELMKRWNIDVMVLRRLCYNEKIQAYEEKS